MAKQRATSVEETPSGVSTLIDPKLILADDNIRFGLKQSRIESLALDISNQGGVMEPIEVEPLGAEESNGHKYRLTFGNYRLAAVTALNGTGAGLMIPAVIRTNATPTDRLKRQLAENMERENQSPMDQAMAICKLLDAGLTKMDVRTIFARPGGRKGAKVQPASNSFVNMTLSFLEFPKKIQNMIHDGTLGVAAAYQLTKVDPAKWDAVVDRAKEERDKLLAREEADDEKLLAQEKKLAVEKEKMDVLEETAKVAQVKLASATATLKEKADALVDAQKTLVSPHKDAAAKKVAMTTLKTAQANHKIAEAEFEEARDAAQKCIAAYEKTNTAQLEKVAKLKAAKAEAPAAKAKTAVNSADVQKAAKAEGAKTGAVLLNAQEMRGVVTMLARKDNNAKVIQIGKAFQQCFSGITTDNQLYKELVGIVS